ncbi:hypothetical protein GPECTOR_47g363 [Gonium pectorale]|uniref:BACK domain-containing protein n=1 Tax=Gonium pectorale TaxID=33097 RepID=A0A150G8B3_GONPE|nr:hypothetical protein GPECTOR_47g363 [Gonium pectorale]|eukprot:KXZ46087.1 hypothetical protein GPECTOR_47g363 [Gonium pectorale]
MPPLNPRVAAAQGGLFGSAEDADCSVLFVREAPPPAAAAGTKRARSQANEEEAEALAEPLLAHTFVLRYASGWFRAKLAYTRFSQLDGGRSSCGRAAQSGPAANEAPQQRQAPPDVAISGGGTGGDHKRPHDSDEGAVAPALPVLRVPLGGPEEVPSALAAIRFAYTGQVVAGSVRQALELYRQGQYLQMEGCGVACCDAIVGMLAAGPSSADSSSGGGGGGGGGGSPSSSWPAFQELYACRSLWPDPALEPAFTPVLSVARPRLVSHFGDALAALNTPELRQQLLALPAEGLEALLQSDDFGTDVEDSVLLLLAIWMEENGGRAGAEAVERLCRLVRLAQLSPDFAAVMLPALACARFAPQISGGGVSYLRGWFPISCTEAIYIVSVCTAAAASQQEGATVELLREAASRVYDMRSPRFSAKPRRLCPAAGRRSSSSQPLEWSISQEDLERGLKELQPRGSMQVPASLNSGLRAISARGFHWTPIIEYEHGAEAASVYLRCDLPAAYGLDAATLGGPLVAMARIAARLEVYQSQGRWSRGRRVGASVVHNAGQCVVGCQGSRWGRGTFTVPVSLKDPEEEVQLARSFHELRQVQSEDTGSGGSLPPCWYKYVQGGKFAGRLFILPFQES